MNNRHPWPLKKSKILGAVLELPATQHCQSSPFGPFSWWIGCLAGSSKTARRILIFSMAMCADYSFELISIENYTPKFNGNNKLFLDSVNSLFFIMVMAPLQWGKGYTITWLRLFQNILGHWFLWRVLPKSDLV